MNLIDWHNRYLRAELDHVLANPGLDRAEHLHKWYELEIRNQHIHHNPETIAIMLKASLLTSHGSRLERLVDRYMGMMSHDTGLEVLYMTDILTDQDRAAITDICQTYNLAPEGTLSSSELRVSSPGTPWTMDSLAAQPGDEVAEVLSTPQKGVGLHTLKRTLTLFSEIPEGRDVGMLSVEEQQEIQSRLERDCVDAAIERWREENQALLKMGLNTSLSTTSLNGRLYEWHSTLETRISEDLEKLEASESAKSKSAADLDRCLYGPILRQSDPSRLAAVTILTVLSTLAMHGADKGAPLCVMVNQVAKIAEEDIRVQARLTEHSTTVHKSAVKPSVQQMLRHANRPTSTREAAQTCDKPVTVDPSSYTDTSWPVVVKTKVGAMLLTALMQTAQVTAFKELPETNTVVSQVQPAFTRFNQLKRGKKIGMIFPNKALVELMKREPRPDFLARHLPMVTAPKPWTRFDKGGFLEYPVPSGSDQARREGPENIQPGLNRPR